MAGKGGLHMLKQHMQGSGMQQPCKMVIACSTPIILKKFGGWRDLRNIAFLKVQLFQRKKEKPNREINWRLILLLASSNVKEVQMIM